MTTLLMTALLLLTGTVDGRVLTPEGAPVFGAEVTVDSLALTRRTGADGSFRFEGVPAGRWTVVVRASGFAERQVVVQVPEMGGVTVEVEMRRERDPATAVGLRGVVLDGARLDPVGDALVEVVDEGRYTVTRTDGTFSLDLREGDWTLRVTAPGYRTLRRTVHLEPDASHPLDLRLEVEPLPVPGLSVGGSRLESLTRSIRVDAPSARVVDSSQVRMTPTTVERDLLRSIQTLPSVTPSSDYSSALFVRGGTPDQTRILLDGAPVYNPFHLGGFASAFTPEAVEATVLRPGGVAASAPSSLAGVLEVRTRRPVRDSLRVAGGVGLLSSSATVEGALPGGTGSALIAARRTYLDLASDAVAGLGVIPYPIPYHFSDVLGKMRVGGDGGLSVSITGYLDREAFDFRAEDQLDQTDARWGSDVLAANTTFPLGDRLRLEGGLSASGFDGDIRLWQADLGLDPELFDPPSPDTSANSVELRTLVAHASLRADLAGHLLSTGARWERSRVDHDLRPEQDDADYLPDLLVRGRYGGPAIYVRDRWRASEDWTLDVGVRAVRPRRREWRFLPRGRVERTLGLGADVGLSAGAYVQDWWSLRNEEAGWSAAVGYDLLAPVPRERPLPTSWDAVLDLRAQWTDWGVRMDLFHKWLRDVPTAPPSLDPLREPVILRPDSIRLGRGGVTGVELSVAGRLGAGAISLGYRWQKEKRTLGGTTFTPRTDRRHRLVVSATRPFWGERELALSVTWMSGVPLTPVQARLPGIDEIGSDGRPSHESGRGTLLFGPPNSDRLPSYLRIDLESRGSWDLTLFGRRGRIEPYISVLNVLNRHNPLAAEHGLGIGRVLRTSDPQLPVFPSFGLRWRF